MSANTAEPFSLRGMDAKINVQVIEGHRINDNTGAFEGGRVVWSKAITRGDLKATTDVIKLREGQRLNLEAA